MRPVTAAERVAISAVASGKVCPSCHVWLHFSAFGRNKARRDGRQTWCRLCEAQHRTATQRERHAYFIAYRERNREDLRDLQASSRTARFDRTPEQIAEDRSRLRPSGTKRCRGCQESKSFEAFHVSRGEIDGLSGVCKTCDAFRSTRRTEAKRLELIAYWTRRGLGHGSLLPSATDSGTLACVYCRSDTWQETDHVTPRALGGPDTEANLVPSCMACNRGPGGKFDRPAHEWLIERMEVTGDLDMWLLDHTALDGAVVKEVAPASRPVALADSNPITLLT